MRAGVLGCGLLWGTSMAALGACRAVGGCSLDGVLSRSFVFELLIRSLISIPIGMWGGYFFGRMPLGVLRNMLS